MPHFIKYTSKYTGKHTGKQETHEYHGSDHDAQRWMDSIARNHDTTAEWSTKGHYDRTDAPPTFRASVNGKRGE